MPSELTGCLCLFPSALGFRRASLNRVAPSYGPVEPARTEHCTQASNPPWSGAWEGAEQAPKNHCRTQIGFGRFISSGLVPALLGPDWINWDACALQLRDNCITEIYLLLKVSPPLSSIRKRRSYAESHRICSKVTAWLILSVVYVWVCIQYEWFYSVLSHMEIVQVISVEVHSLLPFAECAAWGWVAQLCGVGVTGVCQ